ncbi:tetratricopeptide repeat protein [Winogradskyella sp. A3E31]|uniref:tetratricopeptide repeat protein n=1 Tax=Winogradskyella sp. A3E31 TaxID=3349637 RepID=UPI00398AB3E7
MNLIFDNQRENALEVVKSENYNTTDIEAVLLKRIVEAENGLLKYDDKFIEQFMSFDEFEYYLYAFWTQYYFFEDYIGNGFNENHDKVLSEIEFQKVKIPTIRYGLNYLSAVVSRSNKNWNGFNKNINQIPAIRNWEYCGVFENLNMSGFDIVYEPENEPNLNTDFNAQSNGKTNWYRSKTTESEVYNFFSNHAEYGAGVNYAQTFIQSESDKDVLLKLGKSDYIKVWLNDQLVVENSEVHGTEIDALSYKVNLSKGTNRILVKSASRGTSPYFVIRLSDYNGEPIRGIDNDLSKRDYKKSSSTRNISEEVIHPVELYFKNKIENEDGNPELNKICLANTYLRNGKIDEAQRLIEGLYSAYPNSSFLRSYLITCHEKKGNTTTVDKITKNMVHDDPNYYLSLFSDIEDFDAMLKLDLKDFDDKVKQIEASTNLDYVANVGKLFKYLRVEDLSKVREVLNDYLNDNTLPSSTFHTFADIYSSMFNDDEKTVEVLENYNKNHFSWDVVSYLKFYYKKQNKYDKANNLYIDLLDRLVANNDVNYNIITNLFEISKYQEALPYIDKALNNFPNSFLFLKYKADALYQIGKVDEALPLYKKVLSKRANNKEVRAKIDDIENKSDLLKTFEITDFYGYVKAHRNTIDKNNYGLNILLSQTNILAYDNGGGEYRTTFIYEITSQNGINILKEYDLGLGGDYTIHKSEIIKTDGSIVPADKNGSKLVFDELSIGDVILINYDSDYYSTGRFFDEQVLNRSFEGYHPNIKNVYRVIYGKKQINHVKSSDKIKYKVSSLNSLYVHEWSLENSEGISPSEDYMPVLGDLVPKVHISTIQSWSEIANWYADLVRNQLKDDDVVELTFNKIFPNKSHLLIPKLERAEKIYYYITENLNYSSVSFRQSGFVPQKPSKTITSKLGDCKDLSSLFLVLAQKADIDANLVLILTSDYGKQELVLPDTDFNHCIARINIDDKTYYLELTNKNLPFLSFPLSLHNAVALDIPNKNISSEINKSVYFLNPTETRKQAKHKAASIIRVPSSEEENASCSYNHIATGHLSSYYIDLQRTKEGDLFNESVFNELDNRSIFQLEYQNLESFNNDISEAEVSYNIDIGIDLEINKIMEYYTFKIPFFLHPYNQDIIKLENRNHPINYKTYENSDFYEENINLILEEGFEFVDIPENLDLKFKNHKYKLTYILKSKNDLTINIESNLDFENISPDEYSDFKNFVKNVLDSRKEILKFKAQ